jgi:hypothetical protein
MSDRNRGPGGLVIALGVAIGLFPLAFGLYGLYALLHSDDRPFVVRHTDLASPNGHSIATLEEVDNGLGFGQGMLYDEVHIRRPNQTISDHGDSAESVVFYIESSGNPGSRSTLEWRDDTHLVIGYDSTSRIGPSAGKHLSSFHDISIAYEAKPPR